MNGKHVLVVEDDYLSNLALCEFLQESGYRVEPAYCAQAALAAIRRRPPCALLTDLDLGAGLTGFDVARFARSQDAAMPVVYMSGNVAGRFPGHGVVGSQFVAKPYRAEQILAALQTPVEHPLALPSRSFAPGCAIGAPLDLPSIGGPLAIGGRGLIRSLGDAGDWTPLAPLASMPAAFQPPRAH